MSTLQLSIFLENRVGRLADITRMLGEAHVDILAISLADTKDFGILRLIVDDPTQGAETLRANGVVCHISDVTVIRVDGCPGGLGKILAIMNDKDINIEYMYAIAQSSSPQPLMVFRFDNSEAAAVALNAAGINVMDDII